MKTLLSDKKIAKPFLKWAGGKGQLLKEIEKYYPFNNKHITKYAEPFIGGGAVLFDILNKFYINEIYISDINSDLINTYTVIKEDIESLISTLSKYQTEYLSLEQADRKDYFLNKRNIFNHSCADSVEKAALMIYLNKTCFNGLFRVNSKGAFNVPIGAYKNPLICDENNLRIVSEKLQKVNIVYGDYKLSEDFIDDKTFVYFDPPYRPLSETANFTSYTESAFSDLDQTELAKFVDLLDKKGAKILVSNSDPKNSNENDDFFDLLYSNYKINRVEATRMINSKSKSRGKIKELLISNF